MDLPEPILSGIKWCMIITCTSVNIYFFLFFLCKFLYRFFLTDDKPESLIEKIKNFGARE
jgi:hypothetical protein